MRAHLGSYLILAGCLLLTACGGDETEQVATVRIDHGLKPLTIGVVAADQSVWPALVLANQLNPTINGRPIRLELKAGPDLKANARSLATDAVIVAGNPRRAEDFAELKVPVYFTASLDSCAQPNSRSVSAAARDLAGLAAGFTLKHLEASRVAVLLDQSDEIAVRGAAQYAAALIGQGGRVSRIVYLDGPRSRLDGLVKAFKHAGIQAIFVPYSEKLTLRLVASLREQHCRIPIIVLNPPDAAVFGTRWRHRREQVYILSQFDAQQAGSGRARAYLNARTEQDQTLSALQALAVDCYFAALDGLAGIEGGDYLAGRLAYAAESACPRRQLYAALVKGRKLEVVATLKN